MDNFVLQAISTELASSLVGLRPGKWHQLGATDLTIDFRLRDGRWLALSTDPQRLALYLTTQSPKLAGEEARVDTPFVSLARKYLGEGRLTNVEKLGYDRVVRFDFAIEEEAVTRSLIVLLTGRAANVLLVEGDRILASLREREDPAERYADPAPHPEKIDPFQISAEALADRIAAQSGDLAAAASISLLGFSALYAEELRHRARTRPPWEALQALLADLFEAPPRPTVYAAPALADLDRAPGREEFRLVLAPIALDHLPAQDRALVSEGFASMNEAADRYVTLLNRRRRFLARRQQVQSRLSQRLKKQRALAANLQRERAGFARAAQHQRYGELLLSNLHQAVKEDAGFAVTDFYDEALPRIHIPTADKPTPREAADHYFRLARKSRHGMETIEARLPGVEEDIARLEDRLARLGRVTSDDELKSFGADDQEPRAAAPAAPARTPAKPKEERIPGVRRYRSTDGFEILVGRTDRDNDHLTFRVAKSYDLWLHAADYPGSHVILRNPRRQDLPPRAIAEAAQLAAKFSQARTNTKAAVNYCERKFVTKMKGFAPGQVRLSSFKTILVEPAEAGERLA